jgi:putative ABC transport system permease protein
VSKRQSLLPRPGKALLWLSLDDEEYDQAVGDFEEQFRRRAATEGVVKAYAGFWLMLSRSLPLFLWDSLYWRGMMIKNYLKMGWRIIKRRKLFSALNIAGLGVSLTCLLMILFHVQSELSYEAGFPKADRIYRVRTDSQFGPTVRQWASSAPAMGPELARAFPEIETTARLLPMGPQIIVYSPAGGSPKRFEENRVFMADPAFLSMFDLTFLKGSPETALKDPSSAVLTASFARKYFGDDDPVGKTLMDETQGQPVQVTGMIRDISGNTHLKLDVLISMPTFVSWAGFGPEVLNHRTWKVLYTFVLLRPGQGPASLDAKSTAFMKTFHAEQPGRIESIRFQPIRRIHLHSKLEGEIGPNSDITYVFVFLGAALLILLIAVVNFVNLSTAQSFKRMKEIGVRKVIGARRGQLVKQHLGEAGLLTGIAAVLAIILLNFSIPLYNRLGGAPLSFRDMVTPGGAACLLGLLVLITLLAGGYPALFASSFRPVGAIRSLRTPRSAAILLRKGLVVFQFVVSIFLIFSTITMSRQLAFFHRADLGFNKANVIAVKLYGDFSEKLANQAGSLKAEIERHSGVAGVALTSQLFGDRFSNERLTPVGTPDKNALPMLRFLRVDEDFIKTMGLAIVQGRGFDAGPDRRSSYIISESTAAVMGLEEPLGLECLSDVHQGQAPIIGVIKDFHFASLHSPIEPLVLEYMPAAANYLLVKAQTGRVPEVLEYLKRKAAEISPDFLFAYSFVDKVFDRSYRSEDQSYILFEVFSGIAILVACLGLLGLSAYAAESRIKEIGIRKTLGASTPGLWLLLSGPFLRWVLAANAVALPVAYFAMTKWLQNFAFHTRIQAATFLITGFLVLSLALITVGYQALRSAWANPVDSLRYE